MENICRNISVKVSPYHYVALLNQLAGILVNLIHGTNIGMFPKKEPSHNPTELEVSNDNRIEKTFECYFRYNVD